MNKQKLKQLSYELITEDRDGALATVSSRGVPHVATVYCVVNEALQIAFVTRVESRKFKNISHNNTVALAFWDEETMSTIQLTGKAKRVENLAQEQELFYQLVTLRFKDRKAPTPPMQLYEKGASEELAIFLVTPRELTYANFEMKPNGRYKPFFHKVI